MPTTILPDGDPAGWGLPQVTGLMDNITMIALAFAGAVAVLFIVIGGVSYLTAFGNQEKAEQGKKTLTWAIIGLVFIFLAGFIAAQIQSWVR